MAGRDLTGTVVGGRYRLLRRIGEGGMGAVYEAHQEDLRRSVAVKVIAPPITSEAVLRFQREARAAAALQHPNIVQIFDFYCAPAHSDEASYLVMELLPGASLKDILTTGPMPPGRVARIAIQLLDGLGAAAAAGIVHRDIKPANIMVHSLGGDAEVAKLVDFGAAKILFGSQRDITSTGTLIGTLSYMSPEQVGTGAPLDHRSDLFALAVCMYTACAGWNPFVRESPDTTVKAIVRGEYRPLRTTGIDARFAAIVERAMAKLPDDRFQEASDMREALEAWLEGGHSASSLSPISRAVRHGNDRRGPSALRMGALAVAGVITGATVMALSGWATRPREAAIGSASDLESTTRWSTSPSSRPGALTAGVPAPEVAPPPVDAGQDAP